MLRINENSKTIVIIKVLLDKPEYFIGDADITSESFEGEVAGTDYNVTGFWKVLNDLENRGIRYTKITVGAAELVEFLSEVKNA